MRDHRKNEYKGTAATASAATASNSSGGRCNDRLVRIVDRYMPRVADENRAYVMHYPHKVGEVLKKAWKLRRKIRRRQKEEEGKAKRKRTAPPARKNGEKFKKEPDAVQTNPQQRRGQQRTSLPSVTREASSPEVTPPDWGGDDDIVMSTPQPRHQRRARGSQRSTMAVGAGGQALGQKSKRRAPGTKAQRTCGGAAAKTPQPAGGTKAQRA